MKTILKIILVFLTVFPVFSQESFRIEWELDDNASPTRAMIDNEGNTVIVGLIRKPQSNYDIDAFIFKMTPEGDYSYVRIPSAVDSSFYYQDIIQLDNGNYFVLGKKGITDLDIEYQRKIVISVYDESLNLLSEKIYSYNEIYQTMGYAVMQKEETGNILLASSVKRREGSSMNKTDLGLFRFTPTGDTIETKFHHYDRNVYVYDFEKIPESDNYLILEWTSQAFGDFECYILKPDLTVECINYHSSFDYYVDGDITCDYWYPDKTFMMATDMQLSDKDSDWGIGVFRCDTTANISDYLFLDKTDIYDAHAYRQCMAYSDENSIYIAGFMADFWNCSNPDSIELYVIDTALNQIAYKSLGGDISYDVTGVLTAKDKGAIIYGVAWHTVDENCFGNLVVYYVSRDELGLPPVKVFNIEEQENNALVFPNPACGIINIRIPNNTTGGLTRRLSGDERIKLYNSTGKKIYDYRLPNTGNTLQLNISNLNSGVYIYEITNNERVVSNGKFIRE